ncbi:MAG TPA: hypothetical protein P5211_00815 [Anaerolineae bacterium]|nr:hypothetical protein [Anaerolineae bacterium]HRT30938.1 hypothetical protein [Anaerolineae bacterium]HXK42095.1 hypothetical protein [Anaerolineae bacterium]
MTRKITPRPEPLRTFIVRSLGQASLPLAISAFALGLIGNLLADFLGAWMLWGVPGNLIIVVLLLAVVFLLYYGYSRRRRRVAMDIQERQPTGKSGLILLLSTLDPRARGASDEVQQRRDAVCTSADRIAITDFANLVAADFAPLADTNLEPALRALEFHHREGTLRDCWIIGTPNDVTADGCEIKGSAWLGTVLEKWFRHLHPESHVTFQDAIVVKPRDYVTLWNHVDTIFRKAPYRPNAVICDVTGGLKLMTVGAALASLEEGRTMQYMATDRDWRGEPVSKGEMVPVLVDITPYLADTEEMMVAL